MMNNTENKMFGWFLIVVATMIFYLIATGLVWLGYGGDGVRTMLMATGVIVAVLLGIGGFLLIQLAGAWQADRVMRSFIAAQQSNDDSDVAKFAAVRESLRGERELANHRAKADFYDTQRVHKLAEQRSRLLMAPQRSEPQTVDAWDVDDEDEEIGSYKEFD